MKLSKLGQARLGSRCEVGVTREGFRASWFVAVLVSSFVRGRLGLRV